MTRLTIILACTILLYNCNSEKKDIQSKAFSKMDLPLMTFHSGEPNLYKSENEELYLSWVEYENDSTDVLVFSHLNDNIWSDPKEISRGYDWFVNWADFPSIINVKDDLMSAHWLQKSTSGTYDYDVRISQSQDAGDTWNPSIIPHRDGVNAEHGFVSMLPTPKGKTFAVWLDGRNTKKETNNAMTLRTAEIGRDGKLSEEVELDNRVCDCCQTGATWTDKGPVVVYRDRTKSEIRDISIVRKVNGKWTKPQPLHEDNWKIAGCPVNGPSIDSNGKFVSVAWFTMNNEEPKVFYALSDDYGENFNKPIRVDDANAIGRVDLIQRNDGNTLISWMEAIDTIATIKVKEFGSNRKSIRSYDVAQNSNSRTSGFPRMELQNNKELVMTWTNTQDSISIVQSMKINLNEK